MKKYLKIAVVVILVSGCTGAQSETRAQADVAEVARDSIAEASAYDSIAENDEFKAINDSIMPTLLSIADLPMPTRIKVAKPAESSLQKKVRSYPEFPGGTDALAQWKKDNISYPREAYAARLSSRPLMAIHITKHGDVDSLFLVSHENTGLVDSIALSALYKMPRWRPAVGLDGNPTDYWYYTTLRITHPEIQRQYQIEWDRESQKYDHISYGSTDIHPMFPGGERAMYQWIADSLDLPMETVINGRVTLSFTVNPQGDITDVKVIKGLHPELDAEAVRVVSNFPRWRPGYTDSPAGINHILPIVFKDQQLDNFYKRSE